MLFNLEKQTKKKVSDCEDSNLKQNTPKAGTGSFTSATLEPEVQRALDGIGRMRLDVAHPSWDAPTESTAGPGLGSP